MKKIEYKGNTTNPKKPIWNEYVDESGRSTLEVHDPRKISSYENCDHAYEYGDGGNSAVCKKCGLGCSIILGIHFIKDGKIVTKL